MFSIQYVKNLRSDFLLRLLQNSPLYLSVAYLHFSCWISIRDGLIWAFVAPVLIIMTVSLHVDLFYITFFNKP